MIYAIEALTCRDKCPPEGHVLGLIKFGKANDPAARVKALGTGSPYPLRLLAFVDWHDDIERLIHAAFKKQRVNGEWFEPDDHIESFVNTMMCPHADDAAKFGACMQILVEMLTGWSCFYGLPHGACRAPTPEGQQAENEEEA